MIIYMLLWKLSAKLRNAVYHGRTEQGHRNQPRVILCLK